MIEIDLYRRRIGYFVPRTRNKKFRKFLIHESTKENRVLSSLQFTTKLVILLLLIPSNLFSQVHYSSRHSPQHTTARPRHQPPSTSICTSTLASACPWSPAASSSHVELPSPISTCQFSWVSPSTHVQQDLGQLLPSVSALLCCFSPACSGTVPITTSGDSLAIFCHFRCPNFIPAQITDPLRPLGKKETTNFLIRSLNGNRNKGIVNIHLNIRSLKTKLDRLRT